MRHTLDRIQQLVAKGEIRISEHGYDELAADDLTAREIVAGLAEAVPVEDYPDYPKGPCVLVLQPDAGGKPIHVLWGIPKGHPGPAVLVTAYRPALENWEPGFMRRRK